MTGLAEATADMLTIYHELNGAIHISDEEPSPLVFMRFVTKNRPLIVRQGCSKWPAVRKWNDDYLQDVMKDMPVKVAVTPFGNADSAVKSLEDGLTYFVKPFEVDEPFSTFLSDLRGSSAQTKVHYVKYSQAQNDNLRSEYSLLYQDIEKDIRWASAALQKEPDAINLWIGNKHSTTALHRDNYENIYCQLVGSKDFVLLAPVETACINETFLPSATYAADMSLIIDDPPAQVPHAVWDPDRPEENTTEFSSFSRPVRIRLDPGDILYLPACWLEIRACVFYQLLRLIDKKGITKSLKTVRTVAYVAVPTTVGYDMDFEGTFYASNVFVRRLAWLIDS